MNMISYGELLLLQDLAAEVREQTLSRARHHEAKRAVEVLERALRLSLLEREARCGATAGNWLEPYFEAALATNLCIEISCWCGSKPFKTGLLALASNRHNVVCPDIQTREKIGAALALVGPPFGDVVRVTGFERVAMTVIYYLWRFSPQHFELKIEPMLKKAWAGTMVERMQAHYGGQLRVP